MGVPEEEKAVSLSKDIKRFGFWQTASRVWEVATGISTVVALGAVVGHILFQIDLTHLVNWYFSTLFVSVVAILALGRAFSGDSDDRKDELEEKCKYVSEATIKRRGAQYRWKFFFWFVLGPLCLLWVPLKFVTRSQLLAVPSFAIGGGFVGGFLGYPVTGFVLGALAGAAITYMRRHRNVAELKPKKR